MSRKPNRTRPLDRDGDGRDGGSLPGNQTAPMAAGETPIDTAAHPIPGATVIPSSHVRSEDADFEQVDDLADARTTPGDSPDKLEAIERETDEANAAARAAGGDALAAIADAEPDLVAQVLQDDADAEQRDTFSAEEVEAAPAAVAVRARELRLLLDSRRLYKSDQGYSATYGAPYVEQAVVDSWIEAGLAEFDATAGICGGVKPTHEARRQLNQLTLSHYAPGTIGAAGEETSDAV